MASSRHKKNKYRRDEEMLRAALRQKLAPQQKDSIFKSSFAAFGSMDSANKGSGDAKSSSVADPLKSDTWYYLFQDMIEMFSYRLRFSPQSPKDEIKIFYIGSQGLIAARFIRGNETFNVFANIDEEGEIEEECDYLAFGCSCRASQGKYECEHSCRLINGVIGLLSKADSDLSARINQGRFSAEPLDM